MRVSKRVRVVFVFVGECSLSLRTQERVFIEVETEYPFGGLKRGTSVR